MALMNVSQYARHAGMSRQALYTWEAKQGFPARVDGRIDQAACDAYLARYRCHSDPRIKNAKKKTPSGAGHELAEMNVATIKAWAEKCQGLADNISPDERAALAARSVGLYLSTGPYNPPVTFGGYRLSVCETPQYETGHIIAGGAFGLTADDVLFECRVYVLELMDDETEETAIRHVVPSLLYTLAEDD